MIIRFDDSLPALISALMTCLSRDLISQGVVVRDVKGRLSFVLPVDIGPTRFDVLQTELIIKLGAYARPDRVLARPADVGAQDLLASNAALPLIFEDVRLRMIDRRLVGADWLRIPSSKALPPPRFVFASLKGGVGRSTALSVAASHLASRGKRVLAVDLDMEAPGLGSLLLDYDTLPPFGLIDALVENGISELDERFLADLIGPSTLAERHGRIDVMPAFGRKSVDNPADVLSKIARAYAEDVRPDGSVASLSDQISELIARYADPLRYDAILIDSRAGLHETAATAILGLGAEVFLFGLDEPQTFQGYAALLSHLARFATAQSGMLEWVERMSVVQGKAPLDDEARAAFADRFRQLFVESGLERQVSDTGEEPQPPAQPFSNVPWDDDLSDEEVLPADSEFFREPAVVLNDEMFKNFDPRKRRDLLTEKAYHASFGSFLERVDEAFPGITESGDA